MHRKAPATSGTHRRGRIVCRSSAAEHAGGVGPVLAAGDRLDGTRREHEALEQRVRRQAVRAVDAGAGRLAAGPQAGQRRRAVEVGADAAATGSARRERRAASRGWDRARPLWQARQIVGNRAGNPAIAVASSQRWSRPRSLSRRLIARATTSRGARSAERVLGRHERDALVVAQDRAFAAERLGEQAAAASTGGAARWDGTA